MQNTWNYIGIIEDKMRLCRMEGNMSSAIAVWCSYNMWSNNGTFVRPVSGPHICCRK